MTGSRHLAGGMSVCAIVAGVAAIACWATVSGLVNELGSTERAIEMISYAGPYLVVVFMVLAIVASPIPSGPIALAAGAVYGAVVGSLLVWVGAVLGATIAFFLSRKLGYRALQSSAMPVAVWLTRPRSQTMLMLIVLVSRLVPFISFDAISYIAGLTPISAWRFVGATALGVLPVCFGFASMGAGMKEGELNWMLAAAVCAITLLLPAVILLWRTVNSRRTGG